MKRFWGVTVCMLAVASAGVAQTQTVQAPASTPSLGDLARAVRSERARDGKRPARVVTNDNLPTRLPEAAPTDASNMSANSASGTPTASTGGGSPSASSDSLYRKQMGELRAKLDTHRRQLEVLQQKLSQNNMQFYSDPNKALNQEFTRADINKLTQDLEAKKKEVEADQKAIEDLQDQLRRQRVDPGFIRDLMSAPIPPPGEPGASQAAASPTTDTDANPDDRKKTKDYWQARFKAAREQVAQAQEGQHLAEDELNLLKIQQARELDPAVQEEVKQKITTKNSELEAKRATTAKAQKALETLEAAFKDSGAPGEWSKTE